MYIRYHQFYFKPDPFMVKTVRRQCMEYTYAVFRYIINLHACLFLVLKNMCDHSHAILKSDNMNLQMKTCFSLNTPNLAKKTL